MMSWERKTCWFCMLRTMMACPEMGKGWFKCSGCGATYVDLPDIEAPALMPKAYRTGAGWHFSPRPVTKHQKGKK